MEILCVTLQDFVENKPVHFSVDTHIFVIYAYQREKKRTWPESCITLHTSGKMSFVNALNSNRLSNKLNGRNLLGN